MPAASGFALAFSSLLRIFPGVFVLGSLLQQLREGWRLRRVPTLTPRFVAGAAVSVVLFVGASVWGGGFAAYAEFFEKITVFAGHRPDNAVGLPALSAEYAGGTRIAELPIVGGFLFLFIRALRRAENWEAAAMGFTLIPVLGQPANYYYSFVIAAVFLATRRPRIAVWLLAASIVWAATGLVLYMQDVRFVAFSVTAVALCFAVVWEMTRPAEDEAEPGAAEQPI